MSEVVWERRECVSAEVEGSLVLLDLETLNYHSLNQTAAAVWELLATPRDAAAVSADLCDRYNVTAEHCRTSVDRLLAELSSHGLVKSHASAANSF